MRLPLIPLIIMLVVIIASDCWLFYRWIKKIKNFWLRLAFWTPSVFFILFLGYIGLQSNQIETYQYAAKLIWIFLLFVIIYPPKIIYALFDFLGVLVNTLLGVTSKILSCIGAGIAILLVILITYGTFIERNRVHIKEVDIPICNLPESFDGFVIAQFSDAHLGNWNMYTKTIERTVKLINSCHPDMIVFTGDMVNNFATELIGYDSIFNSLTAPYGKFAILGNHDYGDYTQWKNKETRNANLNATKNGIKNLGFDLLLNEYRIIEKNSQYIYIVGVENWSSSKHFPRYGNLNKALAGTDSTARKILLSHDSSHWDAEIVGHNDIVLTLAGHTHAAQIGFITNHIKFSPSAWIYDEWDGLYTKQNQFLYVNRGIGYVGIPLRLGVPPEITILTLRKN